MSQNSRWAELDEFDFNDNDYVSAISNRGHSQDARDSLKPVNNTKKLTKTVYSVKCYVFYQPEIDWKLTKILEFCPEGVRPSK